MSQPNAISYYAQAKSFAAYTLASAGTHALGAWMLTPVNPVAGAIIGATSYASSKAIDLICKKLHINQQGLIARTTQHALSIIAGIALGTIAAQAIGFQITFLAAVLVSVATSALYVIATGLAVGFVVAGVLAALALLKLLPGDAQREVDQVIDDFHDILSTVQRNLRHFNKQAAQTVSHFREAMREGTEYLGLSQHRTC